MKPRQQWLSSRLSSSGLKSHRVLHSAGGGWDWWCDSSSDTWLTVCSVLTPAKGPLVSLLLLLSLSSSTLCFGLTPWPGIGTGSPDKSACWLWAEILTASWKNRDEKANSWQAKTNAPISTSDSNVNYANRRSTGKQTSTKRVCWKKKYIFNSSTKSLLNNWLASNCGAVNQIMTLKHQTLDSVTFYHWCHRKGWAHTFYMVNFK